MSSFAYTWKLTDIGLDAIAAAEPVLHIRPAVPAFGPDGLVSSHPVAVTPNGSGVYSATLYPSGELTPSGGGNAGVDYIISVGFFDKELDGTEFRSVDNWRFTAVADGGNVGDMAGGSLLAVWVPPWPDYPLPKGLYIDTAAPNDFGIVY